MLHVVNYLLSLGFNEKGLKIKKAFNFVYFWLIKALLVLGYQVQ